MASLGNSTKHTNKNSYKYFSNSFKRLKRREHSQSHSMKLPSPKSDKDTTKKRKLQANIFDEYRCKNSQQNISKPYPTTYKKDHTAQLSWIHPSKSINVIHHINKRKPKNHMIISINEEKAFDKIQHPFIIKNFYQSGYKGNISQYHKSYL